MSDLSLLWKLRKLLLQHVEALLSDNLQWHNWIDQQLEAIIFDEACDVLFGTNYNE